MTMTKTKQIKKITRWFKSRETGQLYKTERHRDGTATCFCPGFVYNRKCWHTEQAGTWK